MTKIKKLPEEAESDFSLFLNSLPGAYELRTDWAKEVKKKIEDLILDEANKIAIEVEVKN